MDEFESLALGVLDLSLDEYEGISLRAFFNKLEGYEKRQRVEWERARMISFYSVTAHVKNIKKPTDLFKFEWEKDKPRELTERDLEISKKWDG